MTNSHKGTRFNDFLEKEGLLEQVEAVAVKRVVSYQIEKEMEKQHISKKIMAENMRTSRSALDRVLDPDNTSVTLNSLVKAAHAIGKKIKISFSSEPDKA